MKDGEELDNSERRKHRSSRTHKRSSQLEPEETNNGNIKSNGDHDRRRSSKAGSDDEVDYDLKRESRFKIPRKSTDERSERRTSEHHHESSRKSNSNTFYDRGAIKAGENEWRYSDRKEGGREKDSEKSNDDDNINKSYEIDEKISNVERSHAKFHAQKEDDMAGISPPRKSRDDKQRHKERSDDSEPQHSSRSQGEKSEKPGKRYRSPERSRKHCREFDDTDKGYSESDTERQNYSKGKTEKGYYEEDRSPKRNWRRSHSRKEDKSDDYKVDYAEHEKERIKDDRVYRTGHRKDSRTWTENMRALSHSGAMYENSDSIEIKPTQKPDVGRDDPDPPEENRFHDDRDILNSPASRESMNFNRTSSGQSLNSNNVHQPPNNNNFNHGGGRFSRGRGKPPLNRDSQPRMPSNMMGPPFGPIQPIGPNMNLPMGPPISPSIFMPQYPGPLVWAGPRGVDMNMPGVPPNVHPLPPVHGGPMFRPNIGNLPNHPIYFNQQGLGRGVVPSSLPGPAFNSAGPTDRDMSNELPPTNWIQTRNTMPPGSAPSRGDQNDYSQNFVDTGMRPQNFIRELELTSVVEDYPKLRELIQRKDEIVKDAATPPMYFKCDLKEHELTPDSFGTKFDVILVDPPWEEYVHRAPGVTDHLDYWTFEEIQNLKIEAIADTPSFIFLWVGDGVGLEQGRQCLKKWGFRRCEDICWVKTNKKNATRSLRHDSNTILQHSKEHCLMGIKGTVRRSTDGHIIHANIDTDIIIAEEPPDGSTRKPDDMYRIIEHFALGKRRLELFGEDHNIRSGWLTVGKGLSSSNFNVEGYIRNFADKDGKVWHGGGGRNPPPEAPHLILTTPEIESLRPKSPPPKNQQQQQQPPMALVAGGNFNNRRSSGDSSQNPNFSSMHSHTLGSENPNQGNWGSSPMIRGPESGNFGNSYYDAFGFNSNFGQAARDGIDINPNRTFTMNMNMM